VSPNPSTGTGTDNETEDQTNGTEHRRKKSREDRKLEAYIKAFERLEQKEKKKELNLVVGGGAGNHNEQYNSRRPSRDNQQETEQQAPSSLPADNTTTYVVLTNNEQLTKSEQQETINETTASKDTSLTTNNVSGGAKRSTRKKGGRAARKGSRKSRTVSADNASDTGAPTEPLSSEPAASTENASAEQSSDQQNTLDDAEVVVPSSSLQTEKFTDETDGRVSHHVQENSAHVSDTNMKTTHTDSTAASNSDQNGCIAAQGPPQDSTLPSHTPTTAEDHLSSTTLVGVECDSTTPPSTGDHCRTVKSDATSSDRVRKHQARARTVKRSSSRI